MATFDFKCPECENVQEVWVQRISLADELHPPCEKCGTPTSKTFIAANFTGHFVLKGEWDGKLAREAKYRQKRSEQMAKKQKDNVFVPKLQPNVEGERVDSWSDAKKLAKDKGYDTTNYDNKVQRLSKGNQ
jgi:predicted nucleic acid-binding Zn ribbon protein